MRKELERLEELGCLKRVERRPKIFNPMSVVYSNKWRLVIDGSRGLNPFCKRRGVHLEDLSHVARTVGKGDFMVCRVGSSNLVRGLASLCRRAGS